MIKCIFTKHGQIIGDFTERFNGEQTEYEINNPCIVQIGNSPNGKGQVFLMSMTTTTEEKSIVISEDDINFKQTLYTPTPELHNYYTSLFAPAVELITQPNKIIIP